MKIRPANDSGRFFVESDRDPSKEYLVDLVENRGHGRCDCEDFRCRRQKMFEAGDATDEARCKHLIYVREAMAQALLEAFIKEALQMERQPMPEKKTEYRGLPSISESRKPRMAEYMKRRAKFLKKYPKCAVYPDLDATDVHHTRGRVGSLLLNTNYWMAVSRKAHNEIGDNIEWAREKGYIAAKGEWGTEPTKGSDNVEDDHE